MTLFDVIMDSLSVSWLVSRDIHVIVSHVFSVIVTSSLPRWRRRRSHWLARSTSFLWRHNPKWKWMPASI